MGPWPTSWWHWTHPYRSAFRPGSVGIPRVPWVVISSTSSPWQRMQLAYRTAALPGLMRMGSWKSWAVKAFEWW